MKQRVKILIILLIITVSAGGYFFYFKKPAHVSQIRVSGNIEVTTVGVGFKIPGHVAKRLVNEGETVRKGQLVAILETADLELAVAEAQAQLMAARASLSELKNGSRRQEVLAAQAVVRRMEADTNNAGADDQRLQALFAMNAVSAQERERARTLYLMAQSRYEEAKEQLKLVMEGPRSEQIDLAQARAEQAEKQLSLAQTRLNYARVFSPLDGVVLSDNIEAGEYVTAGTPVVTIGDISQVWLKAYVNETNLGQIKLGQKAAVTTDTFPGKMYPGHISFIASQAEFTPKTIQTTEERVKLVYRIKITVDNDRQELKPGMPADAVIAVGD